MYNSFNISSLNNPAVFVGGFDYAYEPTMLKIE